MSSLTFARIIDPVCSCGNYVGQLQHEIEFRLIEKGGETDDTDVAIILNDMGVKRMCCRRTIIISPVLRLVQAEPEFNIYFDTRTISKRLERLNVGNPDSPQIN